MDIALLPVIALHCFLLERTTAILTLFVMRTNGNASTSQAMLE